MLVDARQLEDKTVIETDVCIVGAGAAGITLAREFFGQRITVCLVESGGLEFDEETQSLYQGKAVGLPLSDLDVSRQRYFGGTTNRWSGVCRPLDDDDFQAKSWIPYSGWPITKADLVSYYDRAWRIIELPSNDFSPESWADYMPDFFRLPFIGDRLIPAVYQKSPPTRFGKVYRKELAKSSNVTTYLFANVVDIETNDTARTVTRLRLACLGGKRLWVKATLYILATSGIENARILLVANKVQTAGLGNTHGLVGRFFMTRPELEEAWILLPEASHLATPPLAAATLVVPRLTLSDHVMATERLAKFYIQLEPATEPGKIIQSPGYTSLKALATDIRHGNFPEHLRMHLGNVITDMHGMASGLIRRYGKASIIRLLCGIEQVPNPDSRVSLMPERDAFGLCKVEVDWRLTAFDKHTLRRSLGVIGEEIGRAGIGRLKIGEWVASDDLSTFPGFDAWHHIGTTRMSDDPKTGVVDKHGRVHGVENLYVAGSSVFPTQGRAAPTLTIVALSLRLADHVKAKLAQPITSSVEN